MQVPRRKPGKLSHFQPDPLMTEAMLSSLKQKLAKLKKAHPRAASEVGRLAELGDFSENTEYQMAKGRLRGLNNAIENLENQINHAVVIALKKNNDVVQIGSAVTISCKDNQKTYQILGSSETNPSKGIISRNSPIGSALLGHKVGEAVTINVAGKEAVYKIVKLS